MKKATQLKSLVVSMAIASSSLIALAPIAAQAEVSANVAATSNYMWRGVTQSSNNAAIQGGIDYSADSGLYVGTWGSTLGGASGYEQDVYVGFAGTAASIDYDLGYIYYAYPIQDNADFSEVYVSGGIAGFTAGINYSVSEAATDAETGDLYAFASYGMDISDKTNFGITVGNQSFAEKNSDAYTHLQVSFGVENFTFAYDKNMDEDSGGLNKDKPVLSISYSHDLSF